MDVNEGVRDSAGEPAGDDDEVGVPDADVPPLRARLEALLLVVDQPVGEAVLASAAEATPGEVEQELLAWRGDLTAAGSGIDLRRTGEGWRLYTRRGLAPYVERLLTDGTRSTLTRAALETLAVIAYRQPVSRGRIAAIRGVNVDSVVRTLLTRGLIEEAGQDEEGGAMQYRTSNYFLERLGLGSVADLPPLAPYLPDLDTLEDLDQELR